MTVVCLIESDEQRQKTGHTSESCLAPGYQMISYITKTGKVQEAFLTMTKIVF